MGRRKRKKDKAKVDLCAYCGNMRDCTDEHVIPRCFYPDDVRPNRDGFVIINVCERCNGEKSREDSYMRDIFVTDAAVSDKPIPRRLMETVLSSHRQNFSDHCRTAVRFNRIGAGSHLPGASYLGPYVTVPFKPKRMRRFFRRVVWGLYWDMKKSRLPECTFDYDRISPQDYGRLLIYFQNHNAIRPIAIGQGVFDWTVMVGLEVPTVTCWLFRIYEGIYFIARTGPASFFNSALPLYRKIDQGNP